MKVCAILMVLALVLAVAFTDDTTPAPGETPADGGAGAVEPAGDDKAEGDPAPSNSDSTNTTAVPDGAGCLGFSGGVTGMLLTSIAAMYLK